MQQLSCSTGHTSVQGILGASGGIHPARRHRAQVALTLPEREEILGRRRAFADRHGANDPAVNVSLRPIAALFSQRLP